MPNPGARPAWSEAARLSALHETGLLDTPPEPAFDDLVRAVASVLGAPMAAVSLVDAERQWFKAEIGLGIRETPIDQSFCVHGIRRPGGFIVPDASRDSLFESNPLVTGDPHIRFYAGEPLESPDGLPLGMLCVLDTKARPEGLTPEQAFIFKTLAHQVSTQIALRAAVAERDLAIAEQRRAETSTRQILGSITDNAIVSTDLQGRVRSWNTGAEKLLGWSEEEMRGGTIERIFTPPDRAARRHQIEMRNALERGGSPDVRWHLRADGTRFWANGAMMPLKDPEGDAVGFVKVMRDRTDERRREQCLATLSQASAGLLAADDPDEVVAPLLAESAEFLGFDQSCSFVLSADGAHLDLRRAIGVGAEMQAALAHAPLDDATFGIVVRTRAPLVLADIQTGDDPRGDSARPLGINAFAAFPVVAGGHLFGVLSFASLSRGSFDEEEISFFAALALYLSVVRSRLRAEAALRMWAETLEQRVEERTAELLRAEEQLRQSQKMEAVGNLTGGLAHDFNNLLTGIIGSLELLQTRLSQGRHAEVGRYVTGAQGAARRAAALTHRLLAFSRRQALDSKPTDVNRLAAGMEDIIRRTAGPAITVELTAAAGLWRTLVDRNQLENALLNLCINARDAMPEGGRLIIETNNRKLDDPAPGEELAAGDYVSLTVRDDGIGMDSEVAARAFDPFFTTKPTGAGTGLGLSMIYGFARQSGGETRIVSEPGKGTTVTLLLPRYAVEAGEPAALGARETRGPDGRGETVLIIDDEPLVRMLGVEVLEELGYRTLEAADGPSGLRILQSAQPVDLLITDVGLPGGLNGRQVADAARARRPGLKVLFVTGYAETMVIGSDALEPGMQVLTKPFAMDALAERIKTMLAG